MRRFLLIATLMVLGAGAPAYAGDGETVGTLLGAGVGGLIGNQFGHGAGKVAFTATGVVAGGYAGNRIGAAYDYDHRPSVTPSGYGGYPAPVSYQTTYQPNYVAPPASAEVDNPAIYNTATNSYCREYTQQIGIAGQIQESYGTVCLQPDGSWRVVQ